MLGLGIAGPGLVGFGWQLLHAWVVAAGEALACEGLKPRVCFRDECSGLNGLE